MNEIDRYVRRLDRALVGPGRRKADLMREVRDGLEDATEAHRGRADLAIAEFGDVRDLAPAYQAELAASATRSVGLRVAAAFGVGAFAANLTWQGGSWAHTPPPGGFQVLSDLINWSGNTLALVGALTVAVLWRWGQLPMSAMRLLNRGLAVLLLGTWTVGAAMFVWSAVLWPAARTWPPMIAGVVAMTAAAVWIAAAVRDSLRATDGLRATPAEISPAGRPGTARPSS
jgi:hypothetical protein